MKITKTIFLAFLFILATTAALQAQSKSDKIKTLLKLTGSADIGTQVSKQMIAALKTNMKSVPEGFWDAFEQEINAENLIERIIPIYEKYYSEKDIDGLITFYQSDLGKKVTATLPTIMQESMQIGQTWGKEIAERAIKKLKEQNPDGHQH
ncbi:DUF2059 domain-containing protein [Pelobium manganitolerans]|uniref:DUF2059 domain-containing protein n=1 Tax=Pelobium manganitolerans TaxID=1842495 RepID=UPI000E70A159|nr:DUF2059 domain-containing protein [Pelobium manganitolerans]